MADDGSKFLLHELFFRTVEKFPDKVAATYSGDTVESIKFFDLGEAVRNLSFYLKKIFSKNEVVGVYSNPNLQLPAVLLAVLDSSAAFYPLSTSLDAQKVIENLERYSIRFVLVENCFVQNIMRLNSMPLVEDIKTSGSPRLMLFKPKDQEVCNLLRKLQFSLFRITRSDKCVIEWDKSLAYVMQTSGTTGEPKAVFVPHSCIVPNVLHLSSIFEVTLEDMVLLASPYTFDPFIVQMFLAFHNGATLLIVPDAVKLIPRLLCRKLFDQHRTTILQLTASFLYYIGPDLVREKLLSERSPLSVLAMGGEACPPLTTLRKWKHPKCQTKLFNIYGITEVSSWATCCHISDNDLDERPNDDQFDLFNQCPLGSPLSLTELSVYDDAGNVLNGDGTGHLWIGGHDRKCMLEEESAERIPILRDTGDLVEVKNDQMWYLGRCDSQIKRLGHRVNLDYIEKVVIGATEVVSCYLVQQPATGRRLIHLFVVPAKDVTNADVFRNQLKERLQVILPRAAQPDKIHVIVKLPLTRHGKVDKTELLRLLDDVDNDYPTEIPITQVLSRMWLEFGNKSSDQQTKTFPKRVKHEEILEMSRIDGPEISSVNAKDTSSVRTNRKDASLVNPKDTSSVNPKDMFILRGGDSFAAVQLADAIEHWFCKRWGTDYDLSLLVDIIVNRTFDELVSYLEKKIQKIDPSAELNLGHINELKENYRSEAKRLKTDVSAYHSVSASIDGEIKSAQIKPTSQQISKTKREYCACFARRGSERLLCLTCRSDANCLLSCPTMCCNSRNPQCSSQFNISVKWKTSLDKCIDASPLVVPSFLKKDGAVFVGSHANLIMSVSLLNGDVLWKTRLGGRVESSCCLSLCGQLIIAGCYDGKIYVLERSSGDISWTFQTEDLVKSSPCLDNQTGSVWVGSHDGYLYALDIERKLCKVKVNCFEGSCFSSPSLCYRPHQVYIGTLAGRFLAVNAVTGVEIWCRKLQKPIFASPVVKGDNVYLATVDGSLKCFDHHGNSLWQFLATGSIFSSPVSLSDGTSTAAGEVVVASHDHHIYCVSADGACKWSLRLDGPVYSTPFITSHTVGSSKPDESPILLLSSECCKVVFVITTKGTMYVLDATEGLVLNTFSFPGEVFSSPVVVDRQVVVGCRNNYLYCVELS